MDQSYDINLQVTSVVSRFCLVPQIHLTEFALDPLLDVSKNAKTLYTTLLVSHSLTRTLAERDIAYAGSKSIWRSFTFNVLFWHS